MVSDPIADMLTSIRNGYLARLKTVTVPVSKMKQSILKVLEDEKFINGFSADGRDLKIKLRYVQDDASLVKVPVVGSIKRVSKPGLRVYNVAKRLPRVRGGLGSVIVTTSKGVMTVKEARKQGVGGEVICTLY